MLGKKKNANQPKQDACRDIRRTQVRYAQIIARLVGLAGLLCMRPATLPAQQPPSQTFVVTVPTTATVVAPAAVSITHDASDDAQVFPGQLWSISGNSTSGVVVEFSVNQAFTHRTQPQAKSDAELSLKIHQTAGPARWTATKAVDATSYGQGDEHAVVQVASDSFGTAKILLGVRFLPNATTTLATGDYATTVSCTVTLP